MINFSKRPCIGKGTVIPCMFFWIIRRLCHLAVSHNSLYPVLSFALYLDLRPTSCISLSKLVSCVNWRFSAIWMKKIHGFICVINGNWMTILQLMVSLKIKFFAYIWLIHTYIFIQKTKNTKCLYPSSSSSERWRLIVLHQSQQKENYVWFWTREHYNKGSYSLTPRTYRYHSRTSAGPEGQHCCCQSS